MQLVLDKGGNEFIGNMAYILLLGPMLEEKHGPMKIMNIPDEIPSAVR